MTEPTPTTDYDRVVARLTELAATDGDHWMTINAKLDLDELRGMATHYRSVFIIDPTRRGNPENLALMAWTGLNVATRMPFVFETLGIGTDTDN